MQKSNQTNSEFQHDPVTQLVAEHDLIGKILDAFEVWAGKLGSQTSADRLGLRRFLRFFKEYADGCHHLKEERFLFANMSRHTASEASEPVNAMTDEHEASRQLIAHLDVFAAQDPDWSREDKQAIESCANDYAKLYRAHIETENAVLYPLADKKLPPEAWGDIGESSDGLQEELECAGAVDELADLAQQLLN